MGEDLARFRAEFNGSLRIESRPERLTTEAGAIFLREVVERLGMSGWLVRRLEDSRNPDLITHPLGELLNTSLLLLGQGWRDEDDADLRNYSPPPIWQLKGGHGMIAADGGSYEVKRQADRGEA